MKKAKTSLIAMLSALGLACICLAATTKSSVIMKHGQVLDLGGATIEVANLYGTGEIRNGVLMSTNIVVKGSLVLPAYSGMVVNFRNSLLEEPAVLRLTGTASNIVLNATNLKSSLRVRFPTNTISGVTLNKPTSKRMTVTTRPDGWDMIRPYPLVMSLR